jgi:DNA (cytosine-5)-methyltransferase 1
MKRKGHIMKAREYRFTQESFTKSTEEKPFDFKFIDLFAGIGGFHMAMHRLGGNCVFASEWDKDARKTYIENFRKVVPKLFDSDGNAKEVFAGDITKIPAEDIPEHDVLCAGFPCQPFSQAGHKKGFEDTRGTLFFNIAEIIEVKKPKAVFLENVRGLLKHDEGRTFNVIKQVIEELDYSFHFKIIRASDFNLPQHRPRLYIICFRKDIDDSSFEFPHPIPLVMTMKDVFDGSDVNREIGFTLRVGGKASGVTDRRNWDGYIVDGKERRIKSKEGKRMQGFPDDFVFPVSESIAMKQLGNSVAINAVHSVGFEMLKTITK